MQETEEFLKGLTRGINNTIRLAYERGVKDGYEQGLNDASEDEYNRGLNDAWEVARRVERDPAKGGLTMEQFKEVFGRYIPTPDVFSMFDVQEIIDKLQAWEEKKAKEEIKVGDEVEDIAGTKSVVITVDDEHASLLNLDHKHVQLMPLDKLHKTGRHFGEVTDLLEKLKGKEFIGGQNASN